MSTHTIDAELEIKFRLPDMPEDEREVAYPKVQITFIFTKGRPCLHPAG